MEKICVIIRVYNRVEDLRYCLSIIRDTWKLYNYHIIIVANGSSKGYIIDDGSRQKADEVVDIETNAGHIAGNSQLLLEGLPYIPADCAYTILLEADTWLYGDTLIKKYINKLRLQNAVWASAQFFSYVLSQATDFAIVNSAFIKNHPQVVTFEGIPEYYVANYLKRNNCGAIYINEIMPVNLPKYVNYYPYAPHGRFYIFPAAKMVTHHTEDVAGGMDEKKYYFNIAAGIEYFKLMHKQSFKTKRLLIKAAMMCSYILPQKGWFIKQKKHNV